MTHLPIWCMHTTLRNHTFEYGISQKFPEH